MRRPDRNPNKPIGQRFRPDRRLRDDELVDALATRLGTDARATLPVLRAIVEAGAPLGKQRLGAVADALGVHDARVAGLASFYSMLPAEEDAGVTIQVCDGPVCMLRGAAETEKSMRAAVAGRSSWRVGRTSCIGLCDRAPAALVGNVAHGPLSCAGTDSVLQDLPRAAPQYHVPLVGERRVAMARIGQFDPDSYASVRRKGGYQALEKAVSGSPDNIIDEVDRSGLRGCGGAGFPTGKKWRLVAQAEATQKYVICNADESEPGAFKDRVLMESDPHLVVEGMALAAFAVGASEGIIYVRGEYERSARMLQRAIKQATAAGWLGTNIANSHFSFRLHVHRGAGAYICGEETALLESLEGRRGEPRLRPPYPTTHGLFGKPTVVNNVETLCLVPAIVSNGSAWFHASGSSGRPGTKMFTLSGHARRAAAFESPLGITVRTILNRIGLGMQSGSQFKMALTGGAAGTFIPDSLLDVPLDYDSVRQGVALGSGVVIIFDASVSAVDALEWTLRFFRHESCGKCTPCREGSRRSHEIVRRIAAGDGRAGDVAELRRFASVLRATSFCGLGKSMQMPITSALDHFAKDFAERGAT